MSATPSELPVPARTPQLRAADALPQLVLRPVPVSEPPYDDELPDRTRPQLSLVPSLPSPVGPLARLPALRLVAPPAPPARPAAPTTPAVRPVARALVQGLLEVLGGVRPVSQLRRRTSPALCDDLEELVRAGSRPLGTRPSTGAVLSLHVQQPTDTVAEVCATVRRVAAGQGAAPAGALALRLELEDGAWVCTALAGLGPQDLPTSQPGPADDE